MRFVAFLVTEYKWLSGEKNQRFEDHLCPCPDEDRDGLQNVGFFTAQPFDLADSPRELHHIAKVSFITRLAEPV